MRCQDIGQRLGRLLLLAGILAAFGGRGLAAQTTTGTVRGYVKDQNGASLSGADVQATSAQTGVRRTATTRTDGSYVMPGLVPGSYDLVARHIGHTPQQRHVEVQIGATLLADFALTAGAGHPAATHSPATRCKSTASSRRTTRRNTRKPRAPSSPPSRGRAATSGPATGSTATKTRASCRSPCFRPTTRRSRSPPTPVPFSG